MSEEERIFIMALTNILGDIVNILTTIAMLLHQIL